MSKEMKEIRDMDKYQLKLYLFKHQNRNGRFIPFQKILSRHYGEDDRLLASQITYAQNRLRMM
tara:strand:- start:1130 stop:1318 length:189 start_codon:yes stop_codon:yes gene_type:complete